MAETDKIKNYQSKLDKQLLERERVRSSGDDHHMEFVDEINGVVYINDARAMRISATKNSLEAIETSVVLIIGGDDSDCDYSLIGAQVKNKIVGIIYLGDDSNSVLRHYSSHNMLFVKVATIKEAVITATSFACSGDAILFSPSCGHSENFRFRGNEFKNVVKSLRS